MPSLVHSPSRSASKQQALLLAPQELYEPDPEIVTAAKLKSTNTTDKARQRDLAELLRRINLSVLSQDRSDLAAFVNWKGNAESPIHRWLRYREAYSPNLITKLGLGNEILDPFCGCGSILIGAAENGNTAAGIDINPLAIFAAKVKLTPLSRTQLQAVQNYVDRLDSALNTARPWPMPELSIASKVFEPVILDTLLRIRSLIESTFSGDIECRNFLHLAWVAILERVGSYFKEGNGIKYRNKKRLKTGYTIRPEGQWQLERFGRDQYKFTLNAFCEHVRMMLNDARFWRKGAWRSQTIIEGSVLEMDKLLPLRKFDSIVFSPPYANRFDYFESMKVELWFGGFVDSYESINRFRKASLRSHLGADLNRSYRHIEDLEQLIALMDRDASSWRMGVPELLRGYFDDMRITLKHCRKLLVENGKCFVVVGNSAFAGVIIPTDVLLANLGLECGFKKAEILITRHLTVAPQQRNKLSNLEENMRESVVVLS
ncbi:SAM-dependent methyltransferase [Bryobacter aggregatus]|uniref:SAM-dependent methyltransferase n=1 Tax=Bryobacter aggregatus TaxID=360054 RepID=UPI000AD93B0A|nr:SAM-dependent methyltransferase [Bryobacter aggregatus]